MVSQAITLYCATYHRQMVESRNGDLGAQQVFYHFLACCTTWKLSDFVICLYLVRGDFTPSKSPRKQQIWCNVPFAFSIQNEFIGGRWGEELFRFSRDFRHGQLSCAIWYF